MANGTIVFVHGTGVRLRDYQPKLRAVQEIARVCQVDEVIVPCAWGDGLGVAFEGKSLPDPPTAAKRKSEEEDFARWAWLMDDPLSELDMLTIRDTSARPVETPGRQPAWKELWESISRYTPTAEFTL